MRRKMLFHCHDYGLTYYQLVKLCNKKINVTIDLKYPKYERFYPFSPEVRENKINEILQNEYKRLLKLVPNKNYKRKGSKKNPRGIDIELKASEIKFFKNKTFIDRIWIRKIEGIKKKKQRKEKLWFAVRAIFSIQIEGFKGGLHQYEDRIIILKAYNHEDARRVAEKEFKEYGDDPYLNTDMRMVRWHYEKITDIFEMLSTMYNDKFDPKGTEVYSQFRMRKLKPEYEWQPIKKYRKA